MNETFKYSVKTASEEATAMTVTYSGHEKCQAGHRWGKGVRQQYILHFIVSGKGVYVTPDKEYHLSAGDIFLIRPCTEIEYYADDNEPWEYYWVNFTGDDAEYILRRTDLSPENPVMHGCSEEICGAMKCIAENPARHRYENIELTGRLYVLLSLLMKKSSRPEKEHSPKGETMRILKAAKAYISANYPLPISVEDIALSAGVSRTTLFRVFKSEMSTSPAGYLISFRISQAKRLLRDTDLSVTAIARSVGYEDNLYFSRAFHKVTGMTPTEYRNLQQKSI